MSRRSRTSISAAILAIACVLPGCRKSPTTKQIKKFADKVCACKDASCAEAVQTEYLKWWEGNMRARGSEGDRKGVEKAMQRYAECHLALVGPESAPAPKPMPVPEVNLEPAPPAPAPEGKVDPAASTAGVEGSEQASEPVETEPKVPEVPRPRVLKTPYPDPGTNQD